MSALYQTSQNPGEYVPFPELGSGSQFRVFDMHDGRILKLLLTRQETYIIANERRHNINPLSADKQWGAGRVIYTQDKLTIVGDMLTVFADLGEYSSDAEFIQAEHFQAHWRKKHACSSCLPRSNDDVVSTFVAAKVAEIDYVDRW